PCAATPEVQQAQSYPVYKVEADTLDQALLCDIMAHYEAGYAVVSSHDVDPWNEADPDLQVMISDPGETSEPPGDGDVVHHVPPGPNADVPQGPAVSGTLHVLAQRPSGNGEPWECSIVYDDGLGTGEDAGVALESCLATLRGLASAGPRRAFGAAAGAA